MSTSISLTRDRLKCYGFKGETYDELIKRLIEYALPLQPAGLDELKRRRESGEYVSLKEAIVEHTSSPRSIRD